MSHVWHILSSGALEVTPDVLPKATSRLVLKRDICQDALFLVARLSGGLGPSWDHILGASHTTMTQCAAQGPRSKAPVEGPVSTCYHAAKVVSQVLHLRRSVEWLLRRNLRTAESAGYPLDTTVLMATL